MAAVRAEVSKWQIGDAVDDPGEVLLRLVTQSRRRAEMYAAELERQADALDTTLDQVLVGSMQGEFGEVGEFIRGMAQLEAQERDRLANFAAKAISAGLAERTVRIAERQGAIMAQLLSAVADGLNLTAEQRKAMPQVIRLAIAEAK